MYNARMDLRGILDGMLGHPRREWDWTKQYRYKLGIPPDIVEEMKEVANRNGVELNDVARLIFAIGLPAVSQMENGLGGRVTYSDGNKVVIIFDSSLPDNTLE